MTPTMFRNKAEYYILSALCVLTSYVSQLTATTSLHRLRILRGPLKGLYYSMPQLEQIGCALGSFEQGVVTCMQRHIKAGDTVYDIGANSGYLTMIMSQLVQDTGQVIAFEPDPLNFSALNQNLADNNIKNVKTRQMAISDCKGVAQFATFDCSFVGHIVTGQTAADAVLIDVETITLDQLIYEEGIAKPAFIKIDVEGAEDKVIVGATRMIQEEAPIILAEVRAGMIYNDIAEFLIKQQYKVEYLSGIWKNSLPYLGDILFLRQPKKV